VIGLIPSSGELAVTERSTYSKISPIGLGGMARTSVRNYVDIARVFVNEQHRRCGSLWMPRTPVAIEHTLSPVELCALTVLHDRGFDAHTAPSATVRSVRSGTTPSTACRHRLRATMPEASAAP
jgi:hypothetical protein